MQSGGCECQPSLEVTCSTLKSLVLSLLYPLQMDVTACDITNTHMKNDVHGQYEQWQSVGVEPVQHHGA